MTQDAIAGSALYALLIGIDCYLPSESSDSYFFGNLRGCVADISLVEEFLLTRLNCPRERIIKLTASNSGGLAPLESRELWPTYKNMVAALDRITRQAQPRDQVYIHYSGHGARASTLLREVKGDDGLDECLVPTDIGNPATNYLRDIEMAFILKRMVDKGLLVTLVLDSCYSGGATRGALIRGVNFIDKTARQRRSLVGSNEELARAWRSLSASTTRNVKPGSGWLPEPKGYVFLAACRSSESAYEYSFNGKNSNGALTYWLLDSLKQMGPGFTYKQLHDRILTKVHSRFVRQTPQLEGDADRVVFGSQQVRATHAVLVMRVDASKKKLLLNTGQAQGVREGMQFAIYPAGVTDFSRIGERLAIAEIIERGATDSWAEIKGRFHRNRISQGDQAVFMDAENISLLRGIRFIYRNGTVPLSRQETAIRNLKEAIARGGQGLLHLAEESEAGDFQIIINDDESYEILDPGGQPIANRSPVISISEHEAASRLVDRLVHLAKYFNIQQLDNCDPMSPLARKLVVEFIGKQPGYDPMYKPRPEPFSRPYDIPAVEVGEWAFLRVRNNSEQVLNITILDLQPDWGITQIYPPREVGYFHTFDPGQEEILPLQANLPGDYTEGKDVIKVFATVGSTNFLWLELPPLAHQANSNPMVSRKAANPLEELLAIIASNQPGMRHLNPAAYPSREWSVMNLELLIKRGQTGSGYECAVGKNFNSDPVQ